MESIILSRLLECPGPYFRQLARELGVAVGTLDYHLTRLIQRRQVYRLGGRPRYFHAATPEAEAQAIYLLREGAPALRELPQLRCGRSLCPEVKQLVFHAVERYPCLRGDLVDRFIELMSLL